MSLRERVKQTDFWLALSRGAVATLLLVWLAWLLADTVWLAWRGPTAVIPPDPDLVVVQTGQVQQEMALSPEQVRSWELFGRYQAPETAASDQPVDAPETRLRLDLLGVFQTGDTSAAGAIIAEQGGEGELYHPGQVLPGNATLETVYADRVMLRRQGRLETLKLKEPSLEGTVSRTRSTEPEPSPEEDQARDYRAAGGEEPEELGPRGSIERQRKQIISGLGLEKTDGGYRISQEAPTEVISRVGLQSGDVIVSVNGHQVGEEQADLAALRDYQETKSATIVVQRGAQRFTVTVPP